MLDLLANEWKMKLSKTDIPPARVEMLPLIDVVFLLLVFFIFAMLSMAVHHGQVVDLPESASAPLEMEEAIAVSIQDTGDGVRLFVDKTQVELDALVVHLKSLAKTEKACVQIFADETVSYQELFTVMDKIKEAGLARISLQAEHE